jgi:hypothetical protein
MRKSDRTSRGNLDQHQEKRTVEHSEPKKRASAVELTSPGGLRLRGKIARRARRSLNDDLELITYTVSSENGAHEIEDLVKPGGPYMSLGDVVDIEATTRTFQDKSQQIRTRLRVVRRFGEF